MSTPWIPTVNLVEDGTEVRASVINPILEQLVYREQHLYEKFASVLDKSAIVAFNLPVQDEDNVIADRVVWYDEDGLELAASEFDPTTSTNNFYRPANKSFGIGITKSVYDNGGVKEADVYLSGLVTLTIPLGDSGSLLQSAETFEVGPYYLSKTDPGKITKYPGGVAVYIGYAKSDTEIFLAPRPDEFGSFYTNYLFNILDRPAGAPELNTGTWTIPTSDPDTLGWINTADAVSRFGAEVPAGAKFFYQIPDDLDSDTALSVFEKEAAIELKSLLPPQPLNFATYNLNGIVQEPRVDGSGVYKIDNYGIWWFNDEDGYQPWASDILTAPNGAPDWEPEDWATLKGSDNVRPKQSLQFVRINPDLESTFVTKLEAFDSGGVDSSAFISFFKKEDPTTAGSTGDLLVKVTPQFTAASVANSATAISDLTWDAATGKFIKTSTPVVSQISSPDSTIAITESPANSGKFQLVNNATSMTLISDIEPEDADLKFIGLHSYLHIVDPTTRGSGFVGKFLLPPTIPDGASLDIQLMYFLGSSNATPSLAAAFTFEYALSGDEDTIDTSISTSTVSVDIPTDIGAYEARTSEVGVINIPSEDLGAGKVVNFRLRRITSTYDSEMGIIGAYWKFTNA